MRRLFPALVLLALPLAPGWAQEKEDLARLAMEAKLKMGDVLREKGDLEGALAAYKEAMAIYEGLGKEAPAPRAEVANEGEAIRLGLEWLSRCQRVDEEGNWDCDAFEQGRGTGKGTYNVGVTGLALVAFLGNGQTDRDGPHAKNVRAGLRYLLAAQDTEGCFGSRQSAHFIYNHCYATLAMCEAFALTRNPHYRKPARDGVDFILRARNPYLGWRYGVRQGENDTSVTSLCVLVLRSAENAGLEVDKEAYVGALAWIEKMTEPEFGRVGYNQRGGAPARLEGLQDKFPPERSESMTACGLLTRIHCGENPRTSTAIRKGVQLCLDRLPEWNRDGGTIDLYYWLFGTNAMFHVGGQEWRTWQPRVVDALLAGQRIEGDLSGSWDPVDAWGPEGGRVYTTAMALWTLEIGFNRKAPAAR